MWVITLCPRKPCVTAPRRAQKLRGKGAFFPPRRAAGPGASAERAVAEERWHAPCSPGVWAEQRTHYIPIHFSRARTSLRTEHEYIRREALHRHLGADARLRSGVPALSRRSLQG